MKQQEKGTIYSPNSFTMVDGDLIKLAFKGEFDVIVHGCNCFCVQGAGIAWQMAKHFFTDDYKEGYTLEGIEYKGDINKLGNIQHVTYKVDTVKRQLMSSEEVKDAPNKTVTGYLNSPKVESKELTVVNAYTQYYYGKNHIDGVDKPLNYQALRLCMKKVNKTFKGLTIGLPKIGCGLAGGSWRLVKSILKEELVDCNVIIVNYKKQ